MLLLLWKYVASLIRHTISLLYHDFHLHHVTAAKQCTRSEFSAGIKWMVLFMHWPSSVFNHCKSTNSLHWVKHAGPRLVMAQPISLAVNTAANGQWMLWLISWAHNKQCRSLVVMLAIASGTIADFSTAKVLFEKTGMVRWCIGSHAYSLHIL